MALSAAARSIPIRKRVVILGGGFGGINAVMELGKLPRRIEMNKLLRDRRPLLGQDSDSTRVLLEVFLEWTKCRCNKCN